MHQKTRRPMKLNATPIQWSLLLAVPLLLSACASTPETPVEPTATASAAQAAPAPVVIPQASGPSSSSGTSLATFTRDEACAIE